MDLFLIRHAEAVPRDAEGVNADEDRPLTQRGHEQTRTLAAALWRRGVRLDFILTSPLLRARQTAQELLDHWGEPKPQLRECEQLAPGGKAGKLAKQVGKMGGAAIALVGHLPDLADHAAWLIGSKKAQIDLAKAGAAYVACGEPPGKGCGRLVWLVTPEWCGG